MYVAASVVTDTHTDIQNDYHNPCGACPPRVINMEHIPLRGVGILALSVLCSGLTLS